MWKRQEEPIRNPGGVATPQNPMYEGTPGYATPQIPEKRVDMEHPAPRTSIAHIGRSVHIKGELSGSEDLYIDGQVEGSIELRDFQLTIGASGKIHANVNAKKVIILGSVKGNIHAADNVTISKSGSLVGDLVVAGVIIEEGAYFKGSIDIQKTQETATKPNVLKNAGAPPPGEVGGKLTAVASGA